MSMQFPQPPFPVQQQPMPGRSVSMDPLPDHGESRYRGSGRLADKKAVITGADNGIGRTRRARSFSRMQPPKVPNRISRGVAQLLAERGISGQLRGPGFRLDPLDSIDNA